jgi:molecular chaperone GrpE
MVKSQKKHHDDGKSAENPLDAALQGEASAPQEAASAVTSGNTEKTMNTTTEQEQSSTADAAALAQELEKLRQLAAENFEGWQRERADFMNYKKRIDRDQSQLSNNITGEVIKKYLVILDDLERALKTRPTEGEGARWAEGIELIYRKVQNIIEAEGVTRIPAEAESFDPNRHQAITHDESPDHKSGDIIEVLQNGYKIGDRILRPALVRVAR